MLIVRLIPRRVGTILVTAQLGGRGDLGLGQRTVLCDSTNPLSGRLRNRFHLIGRSYITRIRRLKSDWALLFHWRFLFLILGWSRSFLLFLFIHFLCAVLLLHFRNFCSMARWTILWCFSWSSQLSHIITVKQGISPRAGWRISMLTCKGGLAWKLSWWRLLRRSCWLRFILSVRSLNLRASFKVASRLLLESWWWRSWRLSFLLKTFKSLIPFTCLFSVICV